MKKITAFLFAVMFAFVLAGCNTQAAQTENENQNGNGEGNTNENTEGSKDVVYRTLYEGDGRIWFESITFKEDGTFVFHSKGFVKRSLIKQCIADGEDWHKYECDEDLYWGSYTGDASKDGELCITFEKVLSDEGEKIDFDTSLYDGAVQNIIIKSGNFTFDETKYSLCGFYTVNPVYEYSDEDGTMRFKFKLNGIGEYEEIWNDGHYEAELYYTGKADEDGGLSVFLFNENDYNEHKEELCIRKMSIKNNILYECETNGDIIYSFPINRVN